MVKDIAGVYYKRKYSDEKIKYELYIKKRMFGQIVDVAFNLESTGIQAMVEILPFLAAAIHGATVVIDEIDTGIHDLSIQRLIQSVLPVIKGQLIVTTHNTRLMESDLNDSCFYIFTRDDNAMKTIRSIRDVGKRIQPHHNRRDQYLKGVYNGIPAPEMVDFTAIKDILQL